MLRRFQQPRRYLPLLFCVGLAVFYFYDYLLRAMPSVLNEGVQEAYHLSFLSFGTLCVAYYFLYVPLQLIVGLFVDRYQTALLMILALLSCAIGCCLFANAHYFFWAAVGRVMMGVGSAFVFITVIKMIYLRLSVRRFTFYLGVVVCIGMLGGLMMDSVFVFFMKRWGWRLICYWIGFIGVLLVVWNAFFQSFWRKKIPAIKKVTFKQDILKLRGYFLNQTLMMQCFLGALLYLPMVVFAESWGIHFLKQTNYFSNEFAALQIGMLFLGFAIGAPLIGWLHDRTGLYQLILTIGAIGVTILLSIVLYVPDLSAVNLGFSLALLGLFSSSLMVVLSLARKMVEKQDVGKVLGVAHFVIMLASGATWLIGWLIHIIAQYAARYLVTLTPAINYQLAFLILPFGSLLAVILSYFVRDSSQ